MPYYNEVLKQLKKYINRRYPYLMYEEISKGMSEPNLELGTLELTTQEAEDMNTYMNDTGCYLLTKADDPVPEWM